MKCKFCDGSGKDYWGLNGEPYPCPVCNGTGEIKEEPLTNDEWRRTCSAEEFAEWISNLTYACMRCGMSNGGAYCHTGYCIQDKEDAEKWLKQSHARGEGKQ